MSHKFLKISGPTVFSSIMDIYQSLDNCNPNTPSILRKFLTVSLRDTQEPPSTTKPKVPVTSPLS